MHHWILTVPKLCSPIFYLSLFPLVLYRILRRSVWCLCFNVPLLIITVPSCAVLLKCPLTVLSMFLLSLVESLSSSRRSRRFLHKPARAWPSTAGIGWGWCMISRLRKSNLEEEQKEITLVILNCGLHISRTPWCRKFPLSGVKEYLVLWSGTQALSEWRLQIAPGSLQPTI